MTDDMIDTSKLSLRVNVPTLIAMLIAGVSGYTAWSQTDAKAESALKSLEGPTGLVEQQKDLRESVITQKILIETMSNDIKEIKDAVKDMASQRRDDR